jgi:hypothetical protein
MINTQNPKGVKSIEGFKLGEVKMKEFYRLLLEERNIATKFLVESPKDIKQKTMDKYLAGACTIPSTGTLITLSNAIDLIYHYYACLPSDSFCNFKPIYEIKTITRKEMFLNYSGVGGGRQSFIR